MRYHLILSQSVVEKTVDRVKALLGNSSMSSDNICSLLGPLRSPNHTRGVEGCLGSYGVERPQLRVKRPTGSGSLEGNTGGLAYQPQGAGSSQEVTGGFNEPGEPGQPLHGLFSNRRLCQQEGGNKFRAHWLPNEDSKQGDFLSKQCTEVWDFRLKVEEVTNLWRWHIFPSTDLFDSHSFHHSKMYLPCERDQGGKAKDAWPPIQHLPASPQKKIVADGHPAGQPSKGKKPQLTTQVANLVDLDVRASTKVQYSLRMKVFAACCSKTGAAQDTGT